MHAIPNYLRIKVASLITREGRRRPIFTNNDLTIVEYGERRRETMRTVRILI